MHSSFRIKYLDIAYRGIRNARLITSTFAAADAGARLYPIIFSKKMSSSAQKKCANTQSLDPYTIRACSLEHKQCYTIVIGKEKYIYILQQVRRDILLRV